MERAIEKELWYENNKPKVQKIMLIFPYEEYKQVQKKTWYKTMERYMNNNEEKRSSGRLVYGKICHTAGRRYGRNQKE